MSATAYITCRELITFLGDYLAGELPPAKNKEFERHLAVCDSCVQYIATYQETIRMATAAMTATELRVEDVPEDLVTAILASIERR
jgi:anti-sigma factor RsiW